MNEQVYKAKVRQVKPLDLKGEKIKGKWNNLAKGIAYNNFIKKFKI